MLTPEFGEAWDWALPLVAGDRLVGVLVMRDTHAAPEEIELDLPPLLAHAALVLHNQILEHLHFERARRLAAIVECSDDAVIGKTLDGVVTSWNAGAEVIYGFSEQEMLGQPVSRLVPPDRLDEIPELLARLASGEHVEHYETERRRKDGGLIYVSLTISPIRDADGTVVTASTIARA